LRFSEERQRHRPRNAFDARDLERSRRDEAQAQARGESSFDLQRAAELVRQLAQGEVELPGKIDEEAAFQPRRRDAGRRPDENTKEVQIRRAILVRVAGRGDRDQRVEHVARIGEKQLPVEGVVAPPIALLEDREGIAEPSADAFQMQSPAQQRNLVRVHGGAGRFDVDDRKKGEDAAKKRMRRFEIAHHRGAQHALDERRGEIGQIRCLRHAGRHFLKRGDEAPDAFHQPGHGLCLRETVATGACDLLQGGGQSGGQLRGASELLAEAAISRQAGRIFNAELREEQHGISRREQTLQAGQSQPELFRETLQSAGSINHGQDLLCYGSPLACRSRIDFTAFPWLSRNA
jgi:hypothetical protein